MKKLFMLLAVSFSLMVYAQQSDQQKLMSLLDLMNKNVNNTARLDSISVEIKNLGENTTDAAVKIMVPKAISAIYDVKVANRTAKPLVADFYSLDKNLQKKFRVQEDKFKKAMFITDKANISTRLDPYISISNNTVRLRLVTRYTGDSWLFFDKVQFIIDGKDYSYKAESDERKVGSGYVTEYVDQTVDENQLEILRAIANSSNKVEYRITGKYSNDYTVPVYEKEHIQKILNLYDLLIKN